MLYALVKGETPGGHKEEEGSYQVNSSSWEFINEEGNEDTRLSNCFQSKREDSAVDSRSIYEEEYSDSGRSTMDSSQSFII